MEMQRFLGPDMRSVLREIRAQLGPDALIVSNRRTVTGVEITATAAGAESAPAALPPASSPAGAQVLGHGAAAASSLERLLALRVAGGRAAVEAAPSAAAVRAPAPSLPAGVGTRPATPAGDGEMRRELQSMRRFLEERLDELRSERADGGRGTEARLWRQLTRMGFPNALVRELVGGAARDGDWATAWGSACSALGARLHCTGDLVAAGGSFAFIGPTGAGKTTTLCKLAVRHVLAHGPDDIALVSLDGQRLGGSAMLSSLGRLLEVPVHIAGAGESAAEVLRGLRGKRLVLIDTPGLNCRLRGAAAPLDVLADLPGEVRPLLVLPATGQLAYLQRVVEEFQRARPCGCVLTKLDETGSLGEALGVAIGAGLAIGYTTDGPEIPDDLRLAVPSELLAQTLLLGPAEGDAASTGRGDERRRAPRGQETAGHGSNEARIA